MAGLSVDGFKVETKSARLGRHEGIVNRESRTVNRGLAGDCSNVVGFDEGDNAFAPVPDAGFCSPNLIRFQRGAIGKMDGDWTTSGLCRIARGNRIRADPSAR